MMTTMLLRALGVVCFVLFIGYMVFFADVHRISNPSVHNENTATDNPAPASLTPAAVLATMSLEEKVGQLLMVGHWDQQDYQHTTDMVATYGLGGIIIMQIDNEQINTVPYWISSWQTNSDILLLISIDQEGGNVSRLQTSQYAQTSQRDIATKADAYTVGSKRAAELAALGINTNLAPVLDYASTSDAFLYERSFRDERDITSFANELIDGHKHSNVLTIPKHFPGHSSTPEDSHLMLPVVSIQEAQFPAHVQYFSDLLAVEPYDAIMTAHVLFPNIDPVYPATLSYKILTTQLRENIGFSGVIITDDMTMGAITNQWTTEVAAVQAIKAGADMILFAADPDAAMRAHAYITQTVQTGTLSENRVDKSVLRILELKQTQQLMR